MDSSEVQFMVLLPHLLTGSAGVHCRAAANGSRSGRIGGIIHWHVAVQHLLRTYATEKSITETFDDFGDVRQANNSNEAAFAARLNNALYRCCNVHEEDVEINPYIKGLLPTLTTIVQ